MEKKEIDWEQRRYEIAKAVLPACIKYYLRNEAVKEAVNIADKLIKELKIK